LPLSDHTAILTIKKGKIMKAEFVEPKVDRDVVITMKESEAIDLFVFIGGTNCHQRQEVCDYKYRDESIDSFYNTLDPLLRKIVEHLPKE
jgi:hypothetical protein